ncbi:glycogen phosphorylase [Klebsormidium nitens]|uniref:Alpha-1,4 glucan phosphorylase n=1 Tax=Klebsormidium nitens TaxID=105231 RepID=A0A1Y1IBN7_KLENI|nr:glycogen phosphorylase [Klebsormidium nitens]|eukprot:GAQ88375.1 glycogen phosphorylase [Klebsormidium nitens]
MAEALVAAARTLNKLNKTGLSSQTSPAERRSNPSCVSAQFPRRSGVQGSSFFPGNSPIEFRKSLIQALTHCRAPVRTLKRGTPIQAIRLPSLDAQKQEDKFAEVSVDNACDDQYTVITVRASNRPGLLQTVTSTFRDLGLEVAKATADIKDGVVGDVFYVTGAEGSKITRDWDIKNVKKCLESVLKQDTGRFGRLQSRWPLTFHFPDRSYPPGTADEHRRKTELLYTLMDEYIKNDVLSIQQSIMDHVEYTVARSRYRFDDWEAYQAVAYSVRDRLIESWNDTQQFFKNSDPKRVYYLSMEFLMGRSLLNSVFNLGVKDKYEEALRQLGYDLETLAEQERDAALGNGGLGRLAACFLDSMATLNYPAWGYGLRYQYGMFRQSLRDGFQYEQPDYWLNFGNPWEIERVQFSYTVKFYGKVEKKWEDGVERHIWNAGEQVEAVAYDNPIPGYDTPNTINLRLWAAKPSGEFDLESFNTGDYVTAILNKQRAETISSVLYPDDRTYQGKELRLKQQHFFVSGTLQDVIRRYKEKHDHFKMFPEKVAFQLNDTHPTIAIPELMRLLVDEEGLPWAEAWGVVTQVFSFTNHTMLPEAQEKWPVELMESLLPRHMQIIYDINFQYIEQLKKLIGNDYSRIARMSIIEEGQFKSVRMAFLALVASHTVNGVAAIHSELIKNTLFKEFVGIWPHKFQNKTNGVTQRRWLANCNPRLRDVITSWLGTEKWITNLDLLAGLREHAEDPELQQQWRDVRKANKKRFAYYLETVSGVKVSTEAMFDVQVKRIHEYKRQLLNVLSIIHRYDCIKQMKPEQRKLVVPRVCVIGGKAAPGYDMAKRIIKLVSAVGDVINKDPDVGNLLKLIFVPDYNVSLAELIIPSTDLSQHISTAGNEASGTSNMKFAMNGALILGTMDGANVEIAEEIGDENMFIFGVRTEEVPKLRQERPSFRPSPAFQRVVQMIRDDKFGFAEYFKPVVESITGPDVYLLANDFDSYLLAQAKADRTFVDRQLWTKMSILSTAGSGKFSSDRTIKQYADEIWNIKPCMRPI